MKTLKQLLFPKYETYHDKCRKIADTTLSKVSQWLEQKRSDIGNKIYSDHRFIAETIYNELLEELKE